ADTGARTAPFAPLDEWIASAEAYRTSAKWERDRAYWLDAMAGSPDAVSLVPASALAAPAYLRATVDLSDALSTGLRKLCADAQAVWPDAVTALVAAYLDRHVDGETVTAGVTVMNRLGSVATRVP